MEKQKATTATKKGDRLKDSLSSSFNKLTMENPTAAARKPFIV